MMTSFKTDTPSLEKNFSADNEMKSLPHPKEEENSPDFTKTGDWKNYDMK